MALQMLTFVDVEGSGAISYLRRDLLDRPAIISIVPNWLQPVTAANTVAIPATIEFPLPPTTRYLSVREQRVFGAALRRSVRVISASKPRT
jgi:hypothetical protein